MSQSLIGIEINNHELNVAQWDGGRGKLSLYRLPEGLMRDDRIDDAEGLAAFLRSMKQAEGYGGRNCSLVLPGNATFFRTIQLPPVSAEQIRLNLPYEFRDYIGGFTSRYVYDYEPDNLDFEEGDNAVTLLAAAAQKDVVKEYESLFRAAGLRLKLALPREMALIRLVKSAAQRGEALPGEFSVIDIESEHIHVSVFNQNRMAAFKIIDAGSAQIDAAIAERRGISPVEAIAWREENRENILSSEACETVYDTIALEIMKTFNFYRYEHPQSEIGDVYFCGSGAAVEPLTEAVCRYVSFRKNDVLTLLPEAFRTQSHARDCAIAIGMTL